MAASPLSSTSAARPQPLSYAERAKRAGASTAPQVSARAVRQPGLNENARTSDEATSSSSSSRNITLSSSVGLARPGSPPPSLSRSGPEEHQPPSSISKSPSKPPPTNVWTQRREQMARAAGHQQALAGAHSQTEPAEKTVATARAPLNGISNMHDELDSTVSNKSLVDPFVVRMPPLARSPPSLDDTESWPEMGKPGLTASTSTTTAAEGDKKEGSSGPHKKGEKTKWVPIPPSELQATHDALAAQSSANSRAQSQHRRNTQTKSRSRHQSQARQSQNHVNASTNNGTRQLQSGFGSGETSIVQSRAESSTHSRTTSVHSSPRFSTRGRRLPDEHAINMNANAGPSTGAKKLTNGEVAPASPLPENPPSAYHHHAYSDSGAYPAQSHSGPHSQSHTPYSSHSPVYYPPPTLAGPQAFGYGALGPNGVYATAPPPPPPISSPGLTGTPTQPQQSYAGYPSYALPQHLAPNQSSYPYMYAPAPFPYYPPQAPGQPHEQQQQHESQELDAVHVSPNLPPASALTRPPPPEQSAALAGYRAITAVPVSPLLNGSAPQPSISEVAEGGEVVFGSLGRPGGVKSPSPAPQVPGATGDQQQRKTPTAFAVGFEGPPTIRMKSRTNSGKDGVEELSDAVKVMDFTDQETTWEFGTSAHPDTEEATSEGESGPSADQAPQVLQPQPHHMLHYPPPVPPPHQVAGYTMGPPMHLTMPVSLPLPPQSPQSAVQPLPRHVPSLGPLPVGPGFVSPLALASPAVGVPGPAGTGGSVDEWEVRDFGYGFGPTSGSGYMPERLREVRLERERDRDHQQWDGYREPREFGGGGFGRARRGSHVNVNGYGGYIEGGRGGFGGRRGRGGPNGFGRGFSRGGFSGRGGGYGGYQRHQPSLSVATGPFHHHQPSVHAQQQQQQQQHHQLSPDVPSGYFPPQSTDSSQFVTSPYGQYNPGLPLPPPPPPQLQSQLQPQLHQQTQPPMPVPVTILSFPLDPIRHYLLGQVEYYFSIQNLASDFFLRKQMDSKGWIPIQLIASFNRVKQLTMDVQMVKDVLSLSSLVEVRYDHVRLSNQQWVSFVLPRAAISMVDDEEPDATHTQGLGSVDDAEKEVDEDEEDDVVFVLGGEGNPPWTFDRTQTTAANGAS